MPNPGGGNQFGSYQIQPQYGDVQKQSQLTKAAPMSGAQVATHATETPRRSQRGTQRQEAGQTVSGASVSPPSPQPSQAAQIAETWQQLAETAGANATVQQLAYQAMAQNGS